MDALVGKIRKGIETKKFVTIFRPDLEKIIGQDLGVDPKIRKAIEAFARQNGWEANILNSGFRVTFRKIAE